LAGETLLLHRSPLRDYYFPFVWFGFILTLDGFLDRTTGSSLWHGSRRSFLLLLPLSAGFWWLFEAFDAEVHSWRYVNTGVFSPLGFAVYATICFSTVLPAVWETAQCLSWGLSRSTGRPRQLRRRLDSCLHRPAPSGRDAAQMVFQQHGSSMDRGEAGESPATTVNGVMAASFLFGLACIALPLLLPRYAFGMLWVSLFFLADPVNFWLGRSSLIDEVLRGKLDAALAFGLAGLVCGFFWEAWNYWAAVKWVYNVPFVSQVHLFEMPLPGYLGYIPFGFEVYAVSVLLLTPVTVLASRRERGPGAGSAPGPATAVGARGRGIAR
jgi:hypothetical protein